jgi:hypothetical protein
MEEERRIKLISMKGVIEFKLIELNELMEK